MKYSLLFLLLLTLLSCKKQEVRQPISHSKAKSFMDTSIERNKTINIVQENFFNNYVKKDSLHAYKKSKSGFWYTFNKQIDTASKHPSHGDEVVINYEIRSINNNLIYKKEELGTKGEAVIEDRLYRVDAENFIKGLEEGIKLMKMGETATFLFPSNKVFGSVGLADRILPNQPLIIEVYLKNIKYKQ